LTLTLNKSSQKICVADYNAGQSVMLQQQLQHV